MPRTFHISHVTRYTFDRPVADLEVTARLRPASTARQRIRHMAVTAVPEPRGRSLDADENGTLCDRLTFSTPLNALKIQAQCTVEHRPDGTATEALPPADSEPEADPDALDPLVWGWAAETLPDHEASADDVTRFVRRLTRDFVFDPSATTAATSVRDFFLGCRGVCEDFARLSAACLRARGLPVRHVVGYLLPGPERQAVFGRHAHAWISVWLPEHGWCDFDPTTGLPAPDHHVAVARGLNQHDTLPVGGRIGGPDEAVRQTVAVDVSIVEA